MRTRPTIFAILLVVAGLAAGARADGVYGWGYDGSGQLGDNATSVQPAPIPWGGGSFTSGVSPLSAVAAGSNFSLVIQNGLLYAAGDNYYGQLGLGGGGTSTPTIPAPITPLANVTAVAAGSSFSLAVVQGGQLYAWGNNTYGTLGIGTTTQYSTPVQVPGLDSVSAIAAGQNHSLAVQGGGVWAWGLDNLGQLRDSGASGGQSNTPVPIDATHLTHVAVVAAGASHSLALQNNAVWAWGDNLYGELGIGTITGQTAPVTVSTLTSGVTAIAAGNGFSLAVKNGHVWAWGINTNGQLGDGTDLEEDSPEAIDLTDLHDIVAVAAGNASCCALRNDGTLWVWGDNTNGALGLNSDTTTFSTPQPLAPPSGFVYTSISAACTGTHFLATLAAAPVPEPASLAVLAAGVAGLLFQRQRRRG